MLYKIKENQSGFSLTEVLIAVMVLTVAIVAASSLLVTLMRSNDNNSRSIQAYYYVMEGVELMRNIRDTNWLHNNEWLGEEDAIFPTMNVGESYAITLSDADAPDAIKRGNISFEAVKNNVKAALPWEINVLDPGSIGGVLEDEDSDFVFWRKISLKEYDCSVGDWCDGTDPNEAGKFVVVESVVSWGPGCESSGLDANNCDSVELSTILTDWKGGVL